MTNPAFVVTANSVRSYAQDRAHFFAISSRVMRRILVDVARAKWSDKTWRRRPEETAEALHVSIDTVKRDWRFAKLWLLRELSGL